MIIQKKTNKYVNDEQLLLKVKKIDIFIMNVNKKIESARRDKIINNSQEADVFLKLSDEFSFIKYEISLQELIRILIVSNVIYDDSIDDEIVIKHSLGEKCPRCWNYINKDMMMKIDDHSKVCKRCFEVLKCHE